MDLTSTKEDKIFKEAGVIAQEARWYFAKERKNGNEKITLRKAIRLMLAQCNHVTNEDEVYEVAVGISICRKKMSKKEKQIDSPYLQPAQRGTVTPQHSVRERLPYKDSDD